MNWFTKDPLQLITFNSYGTDNHLYVRGRALEDETIDLEQKGLWGLFVNSWKRFESDEIKNVALKLKFPNGKTITSITDNHGYFKFDEKLSNLKSMTNSEGWLKFEVAYDDKNIKRTIQNENRFLGEVLIPSTNAEFGVISDVDDTILHTGVVSTLKWRVLFNTIFTSAGKRLPLEGAAEFYQLLHRGKSGDNANPIFYVSHSPWNLYRYLDFFLKKNNFPKGPILLRSFKTIFTRKSRQGQPQKQKEIIDILNTYPESKFILIGDGGEHDADIYIDISKEFPNQVIAIYLRSVNHKKKMDRIEGLLKNYNLIPILMVESSQQAIEHARINGFVKNQKQSSNSE
ncbi:MAG: phosphatase domain-containing protein [Bacteroidota bacterium]